MSELHLAILVLATSVGMLFLYSGVAKALSLQAFAQSLLFVPYFPHRFARPVAALIAALETLSGVLVVSNLELGKLLVLVLLVAFSVIAVVAMTRHQRVPCNCFGADSSGYLSYATVARNAVFASIVMLSMSLPPQRPTLLLLIYSTAILFLFLACNQARQNYNLHVATAPTS